MTKDNLEKALGAVDWNANVSVFAKDAAQPEIVASRLLK
jgi:hypothetical protein